MEKIYPKGIRVFKPNAGAPEWVLGTLLLTPHELLAWIEQNKQYMSEYQGNPQLRCQLLKGKDVPYITVDTYKKTEAVPEQTNQAFNTLMDAPTSDFPDGF